MPTALNVDNSHTTEFLTTCNDFAAVIEARQPALFELLSTYETHQTIKDEIERSLDTLRGMDGELAPLSEPLQDLTLSTFFPLNLPLYSLILFAIAPSVFCRQVYVRPPQVMQKVLEELWTLLDIPNYFPQISLKNVPRHIFVELYASESDAIVFTGKYENALAIHKMCPRSLLLYNGSGINPFVLFRSADVKKAAEKAVEMRCFNSGQDCAGPDAFFVPSALADSFIQELETHLKNIQVGSNKYAMTAVGPTIKQAYITELKNWLKYSSAEVIYGGHIDEKHHLVHPTIVRSSVAQHNGANFHEFFAPFFYVLTYDSDDELESVLLNPKFKERGMYVSVFGDNPAIEKKLTFVRLLKNKIVNDVERGNTAYGGYGNKANFLLLGNKKIVQPLLISRDLHKMLRPNPPTDAHRIT